MPTMKAYSRGFAPLLLVIVIVFVSIGGILYYSWQRGLIKTSPIQGVQLTPTTGLDETANWEVYINQEIGFSLRYPSNMTVSECKNGFHMFTKSSNMQSAEYCETPPYGIISLVYSTTEISPGYEQSTDFKVTTIPYNIGGVAGRKQVVDKIRESPGPDYSVHVIFNKNKYYYTFTVSDKNYEDVFDQILSTFKFLE